MHIIATPLNQWQTKYTAEAEYVLIDQVQYRVKQTSIILLNTVHADAVRHRLEALRAKQIDSITKTAHRRRARVGAGRGRVSR